MTRILYDSINPFDIPTTAQLVGGYVDGIFGPNHAAFNQPGWDAAGWARFPNAVHVGIAIAASTNAGQVLDVETGDASPAQTPGWAAMRLSAGLLAVTIYVNRGNGRAVEDALFAAGFRPADGKVFLFVSTLDGTQTVTHWNDGTPVRFPIVAVQFSGANLSGGHYDLSVVADYWPGVDKPGGTAGSEILGGTMTPQQETQLLADVAQIKAWMGDVHAAGSRLEEAFGTATPDGPNPDPPRYLGFVNNELRNAIKQIGALAESSPTADVTAALAILNRLEAAGVAAGAALQKA